MLHKYEKIPGIPFADGKIPDGYFGDTCDVTFYFLPESGKTVAAHGNGWFTYHTPPAMDKIEALWLLRNHPSSKAKNIVEI